MQFNNIPGNATAERYFSGAGSPEGVVTADVGDGYLNTSNDHLFKKKTGTATNTGWVDVTGSMSTSVTTENGIITDSLGASQNNYNPAGLATSNILRLTATAGISITGLTAQASGQQYKIFNVGGSNTIILTNQDGLSTAANRFVFGANIDLNPNEGVIVWYDITTARWRSPGKHI